MPIRLNCLLKMRHEQQIPRIEEPVVDGMMVNVTNHRPRLGTIRSVLVDECSNVGNQISGVYRYRTLWYIRPGANSSRVSVGKIRFLNSTSLIGQAGRMQHVCLSVFAVEHISFVHSLTNGIVSVVDVLETKLSQ